MDTRSRFGTITSEPLEADNDRIVVARSHLWTERLSQSLRRMLQVGIGRASGLTVGDATAGARAQQPGLRSGVQAAGALVVANFAGGLVAVMLFSLWVGAPTFAFMVVTMLLVGLLFGQRIFSDSPSAGLYKMGPSTLLIIAGGAVRCGDVWR